MKFELRLQGGKRFFMSSLRPSECGGLRAFHTPEFCHGDNGTVPCRDGTRGAWEIWPMAQLPHSGMLRSRCAGQSMSRKTPGHRISRLFPRRKNPGQGLSLQIFLSTVTRSTGLSVLDDWVRILSETKDDLNRDTILPMNLGVGDRGGSPEISVAEDVCLDRSRTRRPAASGAMGARRLRHTRATIRRATVDDVAAITALVRAAYAKWFRLLVANPSQ